MHNQHSELSQTLAEQHITGLRDHATRQGAEVCRPPTAPPAHVAAPPLVAAARPPAVAADQRASHPHSVSRSIGGNHVQTHTRTHPGSTLAAMNLAGLTAVAHAQANDPDGKQGRRAATERQVGRPGANLRSQHSS
jgi:hypothetical protein